jgi:hypothetical protein
LKEAATLKIALVRLHYNIYDSIHPATFVRITGATLAGAGFPPSPPITPPLGNLATRDCLFIALGNVIDQYNRVHRGKVELHSLTEGLGIVTKLGFSEVEKANLAHEQILYEEMWTKQVTGIATSLGLFQDIDESDGPSALLLTYRGTSLSEGKHKLSPEQK